MEVWTMSRINCRKESEACSPIKTLSPLALLNIRGFVRTGTSGLAPSQLLGTNEDGSPELELSKLMGAVGSESGCVVVEEVRALTSGTSASSRSHSSGIPLLTQFVHGILPQHFFFRCLHG